MKTDLAKLAELYKLKDAQKFSNPVPIPNQISNASPESYGDRNLLVVGNPDEEDIGYLLKGMFNGYHAYPYFHTIGTLAELKIICDKKNIKKVVTTNVSILEKLVEIQGSPNKEPKLSSYAGSYFQWNDLDIVFIDPIAQVQTVPYGKFLTKRYISKLVSPEDWGEPIPFSYTLLKENNIEEIYDEFKDAFFLATDIETSRYNLAIRCVGYTAIFLDPEKGITGKSVCLPLDSYWAMSWIRKFNLLKGDKIFQNGKYDNAYFLRWNAPPVNWFWDTATMSHCLYSELPKDLGFQNSFWLKKVIYWKDLSETSDISEFYRYCALDTWATANVAIQWFLNAPDWAKKNYFLEFPINYPSLLAEMTGVLRDEEKLKEARKELIAGYQGELKSLQKCLNIQEYNPGSSPQTVKVFKMLGHKVCTSSDKVNQDKVASLSVLGAFIVEKLQDFREGKKIQTTYARTIEDADKKGNGGSKEFKGMWLYTQVPHGTDTARLSSGEHHFWCGANIQNVPVKVGPIIKNTVKAAEGFHIAEADLEQAESRDTANISGEENLLKVLASEDDFHSRNASAFFGIPYEDLYDNERRESKNKPIRNLSKKTNHGATYNMAEAMMVQTMGLKNVWQAKKLLGLKFNKPKQVTGFLLDRFHETYPQIKKNSGSMYACITAEIGISSRITSRAFHHIAFNDQNFKAHEWIAQGDWTRYCFGDPTKHKTILNSYVAHPPQSLNARTLNEAVMEVFYKVALPRSKDFRFHAQIHDSIFFSWRAGCYDIPAMVKKCMEIPVTVLSVDKKYRTFTVPSALKLGKALYNLNGKQVVDDFGNEVFKFANYWSETE